MAVHEAQLAGTLDALPLTPAQRQTAARLDIPAHVAWLHAAMSWPPVHPRDLRCPTLLYLGSADLLVSAPAHLISGGLLNVNGQSRSPNSSNGPTPSLRRRVQLQ